MRKSLLIAAILLFTFKTSLIGQITILGPTFVKTYAPNTTWGSWVDDPLDNSGKIWVIPGYYDLFDKVYEYSSVANLLSNNIAFTYTLPTNAKFSGTGHVVYGGYLYYNKYNSNNLVKYSLATQSVVLDVPLTNAGFQNTYAYQWGGYSDIDFAVDENGLYVIYATSTNAGNIVISKLNPNTLLPISTWTTSTSKNCGNAFMVQGVNYSLASYSNPNTTLNYQYNTLNSAGAPSAITFSNGSNYLTNLVYNPSTKILFAWSNSGLYTYTVVPSHSIATTQLSSQSTCAGNTISVTFSATGTYTGSNTFTAQLSDASGSFANTIQNIGVLTSSVSGVITATIPLATPSGTAYRVRVCASNPGIIGVSNNSPITISQAPTVTAVANTNTVCSGSSAVLTASGATSYTWNTSANTSTLAVSPTVNTTYTVTGGNTPGCTSSVVVSVSVSPNPTISVAGTNSICQGASATLSVSGANSYTWNTAANTTSISVSPTATTVYTATGTYSATGCSSQSNFTVSVFVCTGISESQESEGITAYPNPVNGKLYLKNIPSTVSQFELFDVTGKKLEVMKINAAESILHLEKYPSGVYYLKVISSNEQFTHKIIKQ